MLGDRLPWRWYGIILSFFSSTLVIMYIRGNMATYIHPRYHTFTLVLAAIGSILACIGAWQYRYTGITEIVFNNKLHLAGVFTRWLFAKGALFVCIIGIVLLVDPQYGLNTYLATKRTPISNANNVNISDRDWFTQPQSFYEISMVTKNQRGIDLLNGKEVEISGFINDATNNINQLIISRYIMSCCAIDAKPATISIEYPEWQNTFKPGDWLKVRGKVQKTRNGGAFIGVVKAENIQKISKPNPEYDYISY